MNGVSVSYPLIAKSYQRLGMSQAFISNFIASLWHKHHGLSQIRGSSIARGWAESLVIAYK